MGSQTMMMIDIMNTTATADGVEIEEDEEDEEDEEEDEEGEIGILRMTKKTTEEAEEEVVGTKEGKEDEEWTWAEGKNGSEEDCTTTPS